jgi:hypothetical protein
LPASQCTLGEAQHGQQPDHLGLGQQGFTKAWREYYGAVST